MLWMGGERTFFALTESSDASMVMYFSPLILMPLAITALVSLLSVNEAAMAAISAGGSCYGQPLQCFHLRPCSSKLSCHGRAQCAGAGAGAERTLKLGDEAQMVWPVASQMTASSMLPVPMRLRDAIRDALRNASYRELVTSGRRMLGVAVSYNNGPKCVTGAHLARTCLRRGSVRAAGAWWGDEDGGCVEVQFSWGCCRRKSQVCSEVAGRSTRSD